ncbi:Fic family protein [Brevundimonas sp.]|uniref:Fic family protein n=1 Tax=Brevundimonas sp. TaxID=1871086 RepID=UPI00122B0C02|nr:Fic family protein [Brevundimonas sp.]TAJ63992.1 MAG: Fic family protein [Brevundimonas sp.]
MLRPTYRIPKLPPAGELETAAVLREAAHAHRHLAELKGRARSIPNQAILIDTLALQEAKASSEVENIVTTQDELFQASLHWDGAGSPAAKEVASYRDALKRGYDQLHANQGLLTNNVIIEMFQVLKRTDEGFRATPGTALRNQGTGEIVYVPPQDRAEIEAQMAALETFINDDAASDLDPLVKMALIHHQFESIHPFSDGNGRIGRILNVLYLTRVGLLEIPVLYLSRYVTANKADYYRMLQSVRDNGDWEPWLLYMLRAVSTTSRQTLALIDGMSALMAAYKQGLRQHATIRYSQDLLNNLFRHPYTRIEFLQKDLDVTRQTAAKYLDQLAVAGFVEKHQAGRNNYYINRPLVDLLMQVSDGG